MKKYHLADLFTLLEVILAIVLFVMAFCGVPPDYAIWVFVAGELCDALDGPCARRWHYPDDGKYRWWRHYNVEIDQISDIILAVACGAYLFMQTSHFIAVLLLFGIGSWCAFVQYTLYRYDRTTKRFVPTDMPELERTEIILLRRKVYVYLGVGGAILTLIWYTSWPIPVRAGVTVLGLIIARDLSRRKQNRLNQDKTPL